MSRTHCRMWRRNLSLLLLILIQFHFSQQQTTDTFPNPRTNGYNKCGLKSRGYVCDPDEVTFILFSTAQQFNSLFIRNNF